MVERNLAFYRDVLPPQTTLVVETFESQMLDQEPAWMDRLVRFDYSDKMKGDPQELSTTTRSDVEGGLRSRNEGRFQLGLNPVGDPDDESNPANQLFVNANNQAPITDADPSNPPPPGVIGR